MINACMGVINEKIPVYQLFSKPSVFGFMWSIAPHLRTNEIYRNMLRHFAHDLDDIPWARTGLPFPQTQGTPDQLDRLHDSYRRIINEELFDTLKPMVLSPEVDRLGLFNMDALESLLTINKLLPHTSRTWLDEKLLWIAALSEFAERYEVRGLPRQEQTFSAYFTGRVTAPTAFFTEKALNRLKKLRK
jgi:asparagine synthase (glutamine-hydrolysing)